MGIIHGVPSHTRNDLSVDVETGSGEVARLSAQCVAGVHPCSGFAVLGFHEEHYDGVPCECFCHDSNFDGLLDYYQEMYAEAAQDYRDHDLAGD